MSGAAEGGDGPPAPSLWSGVRWRRRRAWRPRRSTSGSCGRSRAPTRPASGPRSGIPGAGATTGGHERDRGPAPSGPCVWPAARRASAGPSLGEPGERPPPWARRVTLLSPDAGSIPDRHPPQPSRPEGSSCLPPGRAALVLPARLALRRAAGARRTHGGFAQIFPRGHRPSSLPPTQAASCAPQKPCSSDNAEFLPRGLVLGN